MKKLQIFLLALITISLSYMAGLFVYAQTSQPKPPSLDLFETKVDFGDSLKGATLIKDEPQKAEQFAGGVNLIKFNNDQKLSANSFGEDCQVVPAKPSGKPNFLIADRAMSLKELFLENVKPNNAVHIFGSFGVGENKLRKFNITPHQIVERIKTDYCCEELDFENRTLRPGDSVYYYSFARDFTALDTQRCAIGELDVNPIDFKGSGWYVNYLSSVDFMDVLSETQRLDTMYKIDTNTAQSELFWPPSSQALRVEQLRGQLPIQKKQGLEDLGFEPGLYWIKISRVDEPIDRRISSPIPDNTLRAQLDDNGVLACDQLEYSFKFALESNSDFPILFSGFRFEQLADVEYKLSFGNDFSVDARNGRFDINSGGGVIAVPNTELKENGLILYPGADIDFDLTIKIRPDNANPNLSLGDVNLDANLIDAIAGLNLNTEYFQSNFIVDQCANNVAFAPEDVNFSCANIVGGDNVQDKTIAVTNNRRLPLDLVAATLFQVNGALPAYLKLEPDAIQDQIAIGNEGDFRFTATFNLNQYIDANGVGFSDVFKWEFGDFETDVFDVRVEGCDVNTVDAEFKMVTLDDADNTVAVDVPSLSCREKSVIALTLENTGINAIPLAGETFVVDVQGLENSLRNVSAVAEGGLETAELDGDGNIVLTLPNNVRELAVDANVALYFYVQLIERFNDEGDVSLDFQVTNDELTINSSAFEVSNLACAEVEPAGGGGAMVLNFDKFRNLVADMFEMPSVYAQNIDLAPATIDPFFFDNEASAKPLNCDALDAYTPDISLELVGILGDGASILNQNELEVGLLNNVGVFESLRGGDGSYNFSTLPFGQNELFTRAEYREFGERFTAARKLERLVQFARIDNQCARVTASVTRVEPQECTLDNFNQNRVNTVTLTVENPTDQVITITDLNSDNRNVEILDVLDADGNSLLEDSGALNKEVQAGQNLVINVNVKGVANEDAGLTLVYSIDVRVDSTTINFGNNEFDFSPCSEGVGISAPNSRDLKCDAFHDNELKEKLSAIDDLDIYDQEGYEGMARVNLTGLSQDLRNSLEIQILKNDGTPVRKSQKIIGSDDENQIEFNFVRNGVKYVPIPEVAVPQVFTIDRFESGFEFLNDELDYTIKITLGDQSFELSRDFECEGAIYWKLNRDSDDPIGDDSDFPGLQDDYVISPLDVACDLRGDYEIYAFNYSPKNITLDDGSSILALGSFNKEDEFSLDNKFELFDTTDISELGFTNDSFHLIDSAEINNQCPALEIKFDRQELLLNEDSGLACYSRSVNSESNTWDNSREFVPNRFNLEIINYSNEDQTLSLNPDSEIFNYLNVHFVDSDVLFNDNSVNVAQMSRVDDKITLQTDVLFKLDSGDNLNIVDFDSLFNGDNFSVENAQFDVDCNIFDSTVEELASNFCPESPKILNISKVIGEVTDFDDNVFNNNTYEVRAESYDYGETIKRFSLVNVNPIPEIDFTNSIIRNVDYLSEFNFNDINNCVQISVGRFNVQACQLPWNQILPEPVINLAVPEVANQENFDFSFDRLGFEFDVENGFGPLFDIEFYLINEGDDNIIEIKNLDFEFVPENADTFKVIFSARNGLRNVSDLGDYGMAIKYPPYAFADKLQLTKVYFDDHVYELDPNNGGLVDFNFYEVSRPSLLGRDNVTKLFNVENYTYDYVNGLNTVTNRYCMGGEIVVSDNQQPGQSGLGPSNLVYWNKSVYPVILDGLRFRSNIFQKAFVHDWFGAIYDFNTFKNGIQSALGLDPVSNNSLLKIWTYFLYNMDFDTYYRIAQVESEDNSAGASSNQLDVNPFDINPSDNNFADFNFDINENLLDAGSIDLTRSDFERFLDSISNTEQFLAVKNFLTSPYLYFAKQSKSLFFINGSSPSLELKPVFDARTIPPVKVDANLCIQSEPATYLSHDSSYGKSLNPSPADLDDDNVIHDFDNYPLIFNDRIGAYEGILGFINSSGDENRNGLLDDINIDGGGIAETLIWNVASRSQFWLGVPEAFACENPVNNTIIQVEIPGGGFGSGTDFGLPGGGTGPGVIPGVLPGSGRS